MKTSLAGTKTVARKVTKKAGLDPMSTSVAEIMTRRVKSISPDLSLEATSDLMVSQEIGHLPVVDEFGRLVGIVSKSDLVRERFIDGETGTVMRVPAKNGVSYAPGNGYHEDVEVTKVVSDIMTGKVKTVRHDATVAEVAHTMARFRVHGLPVVNDKNVLVGMVSTFDVVGWVAAT
jgi:CBS domain-containing protein